MGSVPRINCLLTIVPYKNNIRNIDFAYTMYRYNNIYGIYKTLSFYTAYLNQRRIEDLYIKIQASS